MQVTIFFKWVMKTKINNIVLEEIVMIMEDIGYLL